MNLAFLPLQNLSAKLAFARLNCKFYNKVLLNFAKI